jgi:hypothetical protein
MKGWNFMKRCFVLFLILLFLLPAANATEATEAEFPFEASDWAHEDIVKAIDLKILDTSYVVDLRLPIRRGDFAEKAASLVAIEFGSDLKCYVRIMDDREMAESGDSCSFSLTALDVANNLGIIEGREDGDWDADSYITRQEAAVMLAKTYRAYHGNVPDTLQSFSFADQGDIADWAMDDVRLMNQLGIMTGTEDNRFDPLGSYTIEQCLVTLMRLHEKCPYDGSKQENPFAIPVLEGGLVKNWENGSQAFYIETKEYYICAFVNGFSLANLSYHIDVIDQNFTLRSYPAVIVTSSNYYRGDIDARPQNPSISEDGTKLIYTATVEEDVYYTDAEGKPGPTPIFLKGIYTVTMDLKTGEQTYTRADFPES